MRSRNIGGAPPVTFTVGVWSDFQKSLEESISSLLPQYDPFPPTSCKLNPKKLTYASSECNAYNSFADLTRLLVDGTVKNLLGIFKTEDSRVHCYEYDLPMLYVDDNIADDEYYEMMNPDVFDHFKKIHDLCKENIVVVALGYLYSVDRFNGHYIGHYVAMIFWCDQNVFNVSFYDPIYSNKKGTQYDIYKAIGKSMDKWNYKRLQTSQIHIEYDNLSEKYCYKSGVEREVKCPQYYIDSQYCMFYSSYYIVNFVHCLQSKMDMDQSFGQAMTMSYIISKEKLSRASTDIDQQSNIIKYKIITFSFMLTMLAHYALYVHQLESKHKNESLSVIFHIHNYNEEWKRNHNFSLLPNALMKVVEEVNENEGEVEFEDDDLDEDDDDSDMEGGRRTLKMTKLQNMYKLITHIIRSSYIPRFLFRRKRVYIPKKTGSIVLKPKASSQTKPKGKKVSN